MPPFLISSKMLTTSPSVTQVSQSFWPSLSRVREPNAGPTLAPRCELGNSGWHTSHELFELQGVALLGFVYLSLLVCQYFSEIGQYTSVIYYTHKFWVHLFLFFRRALSC